MPEYRYRVKDSAGRTREGTVDAESERAAADMIRAAGGFPMDIRPAGGSVTSGAEFVRRFIHPVWTGVDIRSLMLFYQQFSMLLASGITQYEALRTYSYRSWSPLRVIMRAACARVGRGGRLSEEMERNPRAFPQMQVALVRIGEETGSLGAMAKRIADHLEYEITIRRRIVLSVLYPMGFVVMFLPLNLVQMLILAVAIKLALQFEVVRFAWDWAKIRPPVLGRIAHQFAMSRFAKSLAVLYESGIPIDRAVSVAADTCANIAIARRLKGAVPAIASGQSLVDSLAATGVMLPNVLNMLAVGENTGSYDIVLGKVAGYLDNETDAALRLLSVALFVLLMLVVGTLMTIGLTRAIVVSIPHLF